MGQNQLPKASTRPKEFEPNNKNDTGACIAPQRKKNKMKLESVNIWQDKARVAKLALLVAIMAGGLFFIASVNNSTQAAKANLPVVTPTVAPMVVGQPIMLTDAQGNTFVVLQGSTFFLFPKPEETPTPK